MHTKLQHNVGTLVYLGPVAKFRCTAWLGVAWLGAAWAASRRRWVRDFAGKILE